MSEEDNEEMCRRDRGRLGTMITGLFLAIVGVLCLTGAGGYGAYGGYKRLRGEQRKRASQSRRFRQKRR